MAISPAMQKASFAFKCVELALACASIGVLIFESSPIPILGQLPTLATVYGTQVGFIMVSLILVLSFFTDSQLHPMIVLLIGVAGICMWAATGFMIFDFHSQIYSTSFFGSKVFKPIPEIIASGAIAVVNVFVYFFDVSLTCMGLCSRK